VQKSRFSKLSIIFAVISLILLVILWNQIPSTITANVGLTPPPKLLTIATQISCLAGLTFAILSLVRKEKLRYWKAVGATVNILLFILLLAIVLFALNYP
jgi:cytochrome bd-type quinol oxidase subunit 2